MTDQTTLPKTAEDLAWEALVSKCHHWASNHMDQCWWPTIYAAGIKADLDGQSRSPPESLTKDQMSVWLAGYDR